MDYFEDGTPFSYGSSLSCGECLDLSKPVNWSEEVPCMNVKRFSHSAVELKGKIFVVSGCNEGSGKLSSVESFNPNTKKWTPENPMNTSRDNYGLVAFQYKIFVVGGCNDKKLSSVECFDQNTQRGSRSHP